MFHHKWAPAQESQPSNQEEHTDRPSVLRETPPAASSWMVCGRERGLGGMLGGGPFIWAVLDLWHLLQDNSSWLCKHSNCHTSAAAMTDLVKWVHDCDDYVPCPLLRELQGGRWASEDCGPHCARPCFPATPSPWCSWELVTHSFSWPFHAFSQYSLCFSQELEVQPWMRQPTALLPITSEWQETRKQRNDHR